MQRLKQGLSGTFLHIPWSYYRMWQQQRLFDKIMSGMPAGCPESASLAGELAAIFPHRRELSDSPRVLALGHEAWEKYGLWPTFKKLSDFRLKIIPATGKWNETRRQQTGQDILSEIETLDRKRPVELVFIYCDSVYVDPAMLKALSDRGIWTVVMGLDDKHKFAERRDMGMTAGQSTIAPLADIYWTTWKAGLALFRKIKARPVYMPAGADPSFFRRLDLKRDIDVLFPGKKYGLRGRFVNYLRSRGFNVKTCGAGWPEGFVPFEKTIELINRSKIVLGTGDVGYLSGVQHLKGRDFEIPMCGAVYLTSYNPELADWFDIGKDILCYSSPQNCAETLHWILGDTDRQEQIRNTVLSRSLREHTWEHRIIKIFRLLRHGTNE